MGVTISYGVEIDTLLSGADMDHSTKPKQKPGFHLEAMDGELLLYHLGETKILYLNDTASLIWYLCDGQQTVNQIVALLQNAYPESADTMVADVEDTLRHFLSEGCIVLT